MESESLIAHARSPARANRHRWPRLAFTDHARLQKDYCQTGGRTMAAKFLRSPPSSRRKFSREVCVHLSEPDTRRPCSERTRLAVHVHPRFGIPQVAPIDLNKQGSGDCPQSPQAVQVNRPYQIYQMLPYFLYAGTCG